MTATIRTSPKPPDAAQQFRILWRIDFYTDIGRAAANKKNPLPAQSFLAGISYDVLLRRSNSDAISNTSDCVHSFLRFCSNIISSEATMPYEEKIRRRFELETLYLAPVMRSCISGVYANTKRCAQFAVDI
jgi:hypothetical protein